MRARVRVGVGVRDGVRVGVRVGFRGRGRGRVETAASFLSSASLYLPYLLWPTILTMA